MSYDVINLCELVVVTSQTSVEQTYGFEMGGALVWRVALSVTKSRIQRVEKKEGKWASEETRKLV